jgi:tRNA-binding EMAP/Myf-like protein
MKVSLKWLSEYVELRFSAEELAHRLTMAGMAVDSIERTGDWGDDIRVGRIAAVEPHPNADRLRLATVDLGDGDTRTVVCGAPNVAAGQMIAFAGTGAKIRDGHTGKESVLKPTTIRGVESAGMVLSERELGLSEEHEGILVLPDDAPIGQPLAGAGILGQLRPEQLHHDPAVQHHVRGSPGHAETASTELLLEDVSPREHGPWLLRPHPRSLRRDIRPTAQDAQNVDGPAVSVAVVLVKSLRNPMRPASRVEARSTAVTVTSPVRSLMENPSLASRAPGASSSSCSSAVR